MLFKIFLLKKGWFSIKIEKDSFNYEEENK